jgi:ferric-dicitrate binding protein FerR (iron transport regulator)
MPATLPIPDASLVDKFAHGDEQALVALTRQEYDALLARAEEALGPELAHFKGRVVQQAILAAWSARDRFQHPAGLVAFLEQAVTEQAATQRRKHAALHRAHSGSGPAAPHVETPSAEQAVEQLLATLHAPPPDHDRLLEEAKAAKKAHAAQHVQAVGQGRNWTIPVVIGAVVVAASVAVMKWVDLSSAEVAVDSALKAEDVRQQASGRGQRGTFTLGDQSRVTMGSDTKLRIPKEFGGPKIRTVELLGTARFAVAPGKPVPFAVRAGGVTVTATGTAFVVRAFPEEAMVNVAVEEGSVSVTVRATGESRSLAAGEAIRVSAAGAFSPLEGNVRDAALAWVRDSLVFEDAPVREVIPELVRWFGINAALGDEAVGDRRVSLRLALASSGEATKALTEAAKLAIQFGKDDRIEFYDAPAVPPPAKGKRR